MPLYGFSERLVALDFETAVSADHIIEIGCIEIINRKVTRNVFHQLVRPVVPINSFSRACHGLNEKDLKDQPYFSEVADSLMAFIGKSPIIAHAEYYERNTLEKELNRLGRRAPHSSRFVCTLKLAREAGQFRSCGLRSVCRELDILEAGQDEYHNALVDARMAAQLYLLLTRSKPVCQRRPSRTKAKGTPARKRSRSL